MEESNGKTRRVIKFPKGCAECHSTIEWDCENCQWRENYWKFDEVMKLYVVASWADAGVDLNRISSLTPDDFLKISMIRKAF